MYYTEGTLIQQTTASYFDQQLNSILGLYNFFADPLHDQADCLRKQSNLLTKSRDLPMPRLMNGEISA